MELMGTISNPLNGANNIVELNENKNNKNRDFGNFLDNAKNTINLSNTIKNNENRQNNSKIKRKEYNSSYIKNKSNDYAEKNSFAKDDKKVQGNSDIDKEERKQEPKKFIIFEESILNKLSEILNIDAQNIISILSENSMAISMLQDTENLIQFLQEAFELESPVQLLSKDGIKEIMAKISDLSGEINYEDMPNGIREIGDIIKNSNLDNLKIVDLDNSNIEEFKQAINKYLEELNGKIINVNINEEENINLNKNEEIDINNQISNNKEIKEPRIQNEALKPFQQQNNSFSQNNNNEFSNQQNKSSKIEILNISEINGNSKIFNATLPKTQAFKSINSTEVISQIMEKMKTSLKQDMTEVKILLRPEHLGEVSLKIATQNGIVTAQFTAESQKVKEIIEANFNQLRDMLLEQGIDVGNLEVNVSDKGEQQFNHFQNEQQKSEKRIEKIVEEAFEFEKEERKQEIKLNDTQVDYEI